MSDTFWHAGFVFACVCLVVNIITVDRCARNDAWLTGAAVWVLILGNSWFVAWTGIQSGIW